MEDVFEAWHPGSFTKNFGWGAERNGLRQLHQAIRVGFGGDMDVPRTEFRARLESRKINPFIPMNFFLFNDRREAVDYVVYDELAFQGCQFAHDRHFDHLALFAFNLSLAGRWSGGEVVPGEAGALVKSLLDGIQRLVPAQ